MSHRFIPRKHALALSIATLAASGAYAQTTADTEPTAAATVVVTGTRVSNRTVHGDRKKTSKCCATAPPPSTARMRFPA